LITAASEVIVTVSPTAPVSSVTLTAAIVAVSTFTFSIIAFLKPVASTLTL
jgi:hypothetical protein